MLLGLACSDNNANISTTDNNNYQSTTMNLSMESGSDTSGETGQILPPKK